MWKEWWNLDWWGFNLYNQRPWSDTCHLGGHKAEFSILASVGAEWGLWSYYDVCPAFVRSHTPTSRKALFSWQLLPFQRGLIVTEFRELKSPCFISHWALPPVWAQSNSLPRDSSSNVWRLLSCLSFLFSRLNIVTSFLAFQALPYCSFSFGHKENLSSGRHRTSSGPNHKTDVLFLSVPSFWGVCVFVYHA